MSLNAEPDWVKVVPLSVSTIGEQEQNGLSSFPHRRLHPLEGENENNRDGYVRGCAGNEPDSVKDSQNNFSGSTGTRDLRG